MHRAPTARLFAAVDPPRDVRERLVEWARVAAREMSRRSPTPPRVMDSELLHVTLCFFGNRPVGEVETIATRLGRCGGPSGVLSFGAPLWLPSRRPRTLAIELHDEHGRLASIRKSVVDELGEFCEPQSSAAAHRPAIHHHFRPHMTVARMRPDAAPRERTLAPTPALSFMPTELILYRSWLSPEGASYEALASCPLW